MFEKLKFGSKRLPKESIGKFESNLSLKLLKVFDSQRRKIKVKELECLKVEKSCQRFRF